MENIKNITNLFGQVDVSNGFDTHNDLTVCNDCSESYPKEDMTEINDVWVCENCIDSYSACDGCNRLVPNGILSGVGDENWCESCVDSNSFTCECCEERFNIDNVREVEGRCICENCYDNETSCCNGCGEVYFNRHISGNGYCESCEEERGNDVEYTCCRDSQFDGEYHFYRLDNEPENLLYYGIELETGTFDQELADNWDTEILDEIPKELFTKFDGTIFNNSGVIQGVEIVSHPMTYKWLKTHPEVWNNILSLRKKGLRSYSTDSCGMHIHLSKSYFTRDHLYKFMKMIYGFPDFNKLVSQRTYSQLNNWASLEDTEDLRQKAKDKYWYRKFTAVNLCNDDTVEVRIFRGVLGKLSFWKNVEYVQAMIDFTKKTKIRNLTVENFLQFVWHKKAEFPNLYKWLVQKKEINLQKQPFCIIV